MSLVLHRLELLHNYVQCTKTLKSRQYLSVLAFLLSLNQTLKINIMKGSTWYGDIVISDVVHGFTNGGNWEG